MFSKVSRRALTRSLILLIGVVLVACAPAAPGAKPGASSSAPKSLKIAFNNPVYQPGIAFIWIGQPLGYMDEENLTVEFIPSQGAGEATQWLASGKADMALPQPGPMVSAAAQGQDLNLIGLYLMNRKLIYELVVLPDSPIKTTADIKGKKVGKISEGDEGQFVYQALMKELGYPPESNELINTGAVVQAAEALKRGTVDIMIWADTQRALTQANGYQYRIIPQPPAFEKLFSNVQMTRKDFLPGNRDAVVSYLRVLAKSSLFFATNPEAALRLHFQMFPQTLPSNQPLEQVLKENMISTEVRTPKIVPGPNEKWGEMSKENWEYYVRNYMGFGPDKIKDVSEFFTNDLIEDVNKFDRQKVIDHAKNYKFQ